MNYKCKRCLYNTKYFSDIKRHLIRKKICSKNLEAFDFNDNELFRLSIIPYYSNIQDIDDINSIKNINKNIVTKDKLIDLLTNIDKLKLKKCPYCDLEFNKIQELKNHIIIYCCSIGVEQDIITTSQNNANVVNNTINNTVNNNTVNNTINNTITINMKIDPILSFDNNWDVTHLGTAEKQSLFISIYKYTKTLEYILKNETNLNVLVDKNSDKGYVYKNNNIEEMTIDEIVDKSFNKIFDNLNTFYNDIQNNNDFDISSELLDMHKDSIQKKFDYFYENEEMRNSVKSCISDTLNKVKDKTKENFNCLNINNFKKIEGY